MFITPMSPINGVGDVSQLKSIDKTVSAGEASVPFKGIFQDALQNVVETDKVSSENLEKLATGQTDDLHTVSIESTKAQLSMSMLVQLRNKALDAYSEVMRINL